MTVRRDPTASIADSTVFVGSASVGFCTRVGEPEADDPPVSIGDGVDIGSFCIVEAGASLADGVQVDHYCRIARRAQIGARTRILYRGQVFEDVRIGSDCIIAGELVDRAVVGDYVTFQGNTAHTHADATGDWDEAEEPSPVIKDGSVVGVGALVIGGVSIGPRSYVVAGERVTCDVPPETVLKDGRLLPLSHFRGLITLRGA